ncbi:MAG: MFS transporter [Anaerolineae bacterium]|nr:MFS transporter [Anaerolineae bacterium]
MSSTSSRAYRVFLVSELLLGVLFSMIYAASEIFRIQNVGMTPLQLVLIGTALEASAFLFEVPTGVVADSYSRKYSVIIGIALLGSSFVLTGLFPIFWGQIVIQIVAGLGYTFISGAQQAWITDEIGEEAAAKAFLRASQIGTVAGVVGIVTTIFLGSINVVIPIVLGGAVMIGLSIALIVMMPEHGFKPTPSTERNTFKRMLSTFQGGVKVVRRNRTLVTILLLSAIMGAWSESYDRMSGIHFIDTIGLPGTFQPVVWFGLMSLAAMPFHLLITEFVRRRVNTTTHHSVVRALMLFDTLLIAGALIFAFAGNLLLAWAASLLIGLMRGISHPVRTAWLNQNVPSEVRATVFSMESQSNALGQIAGGPAFGALGNISLRAALSLSALLLLPGLELYRRSLRSGASEAITVVDGELAEAEVSVQA